MRVGGTAAALAGALLLAAAGCGEGNGENGSGGGGSTGTDAGGDGGSAPTSPEPAPDAGDVELAIRLDDGRGARRSADLNCRGGTTEATGYLAEDAERACEAATRLAPLLTGEPDEDRICTQVFGGPQTARLQGRVDGREVDRRLARTNGCEIAEWDRAKPLLEPPATRSGP